MKLDDNLFSLEDLENSDNSILKRVAQRLTDEDNAGPNGPIASHVSHSSSSGRGHSSHVSGSVGSNEKKVENK
jgi:hypothetical protein